MESIITTSTPSFSPALKNWLLQLPFAWQDSVKSLVPAASFRRYYRIMTKEQSYVVMDASRVLDSCQAFIAVAKGLGKAGICTPSIYAADTAQGFILLEDFGDKTYLKSLQTDNADRLYTHALHTLLKMQTCTTIPDHTLPLFTADFMWQEWLWHKEWLTKAWLQLTLPASLEHELDRMMQAVVTAIAAQPQVFMHRDYHADNLMLLDDNQVGVLDFQDAFIGPITYDLASLLRDCYIDWPKAQVEQWVLSFKANLGVQISDETFLYYFDQMSVQRHLKALLTFARKFVRDEEAKFLQFVPRTYRYLQQVSRRYPELSALQNYLYDFVEPAILERGLVCAP